MNTGPIFNECTPAQIDILMRDIKQRTAQDHREKSTYAIKILTGSERA